MQIVALRSWVIGLMMVAVFSILSPANVVLAENGTQSFGAIESGKWVLGMRAGFAPLTQSLTANTSTDVGSLVNFEAMYSLNTWLLVGIMVEWERHAVDQDRPFVDLGHQDVVSVLPTIELRPVKLGSFIPYVNMSFGVNVNSFGENVPVSISPSNNFAWRLGWGGDYMLTKQFALNAEMAYKRNDGHATVNGVRINDWDASSFGFLFGVKAFF
ncbi:MAG TPA: hypothetical protein VLE03_00645 [Nitrospiraceae bacterium]|nr:hypothetical protein [Nitrospiraceae bacterium]